MVFGFGSKFKEIEPNQIPSHWLGTDTSDYAIGKFAYFLQEKNLDIPQVKRLKILVKKGTDDFLEPIIKKGHYKNIMLLTLQETETLPDLSQEKYNRLTQFFKRDKINEAKLNGKEISLFSLKEFTPIHQIDMIPTIQTANISDDESETYTCDGCGGKGHRMQTVRKYEKAYSYNSKYNEGVMRDSGSSWRTVQEDATCSNCNGKGLVGFYFKKFKKIVEKFNKTTEKVNEEILDLNNKSINSMQEYNNTIQQLNEKIRIWNKKCPQGAIDKNHEDDDDYIKYWFKDEYEGLSKSDIHNYEQNSDGYQQVQEWYQKSKRKEKDDLPIGSYRKFVYEMLSSEPCSRVSMDFEEAPWSKELQNNCLQFTFEFVEAMENIQEGIRDFIDKLPEDIEKERLGKIDFSSEGYIKQVFGVDAGQLNYIQTKHLAALFNWSMLRSDKKVNRQRYDEIIGIK